MTVGLCGREIGEKLEFKAVRRSAFKVVWIEFHCRRDAGRGAASRRTDAAAAQSDVGCEFAGQRM